MSPRPLVLALLAAFVALLAATRAIADAPPSSHNKAAQTLVRALSLVLPPEGNPLRPND